MTYKGPLDSGLNRREFLKTSRAIFLLASLPTCNRLFAQRTDAETPGTDSPSQTLNRPFSEADRIVLDAVQMQLFPDDGDGPSARDLNGVAYLVWAMKDPVNQEDGDPEFISKGIGWLNDLSMQNQGRQFPSLTSEKQDEVLQQISKTRMGKNWLSLLLYYLTESLMLDPVYGGNPKMVGWIWLEHQPGFPRPVIGKTFRDFEQP